MNDIKDIIDKLPPAWDRFKWANDKELIDVAIGFAFKSFCELDSIWIKVKNGEIGWGFFRWPIWKPSHMIFCYNRKIPKSLFEELDLQNATPVILWYISEVLPYINNKIVFQKKQNLNLLIKRYSTLDLERVNIADNYWNIKKINWPISFGDFPFENKIQEVYFYDLITAIQSYFYTDYNDAIRKLITSIESYMKKNEWEDGKFKKKLDNKFKNCNSFVSTIIEDIKYIYDIRTYIVHEWKTINPLDSWFVDRAIWCVFYFYKFVSRTQKESDFFLQLETQYIMLRNFVMWEKLEDYIEDKDAKICEIKTPQDIEDMMENNFKIKEDDINRIKENLLDSYL